MILLTGATGTVGRPLLRRLLEADQEVRCLVREPRRLGSSRVDVQIAIGDLAGERHLDHAFRGVDTLVHLAVTTRDQPLGTIEEVGGVATLRLIGAARRAGVRRIVYISSFDAGKISASRLLRTQALAAEAIDRSGLEALRFQSGIIYAPADRWMSLLARLTRFPLMPLVGNGRAAFQPIWAEDAAQAIATALLTDGPLPPRPIALAGPQTLTVNQILRLAMAHFGVERKLLHVPRGIAKSALRLQERRAGQSALATWDEALLLQRSSLSPRGSADLEALGISALPMASVMPPR